LTAAEPSGAAEGGTSHPEARLLADTARGDAAAFRALVSAHLSGAVAIARGMLGDAAEAEDIAQEAFLRLWRNAGALELGPGGVKPWLRRVISNLVIDRVRAGRRTTVVAEVPEQIEPARQDRGLVEHDLKARVGAALQGLPERQRAALVLFHFDGLSQIEVGAALGVSDEAVESLLARARRSLKVALKDDWQALLPDRTD
jgi:RNA polymerase sigma-70 factor (ECF subfamily)